MDIYDYLKNPLTIYITEKAMDSQKGIENRDGFHYGQDNRHLLTKAEKYASNSFHIYIRLTDIISNLSYTSSFLKRYPDRKYLQKNNINELIYLKYHLEVYVHKMHTILEIMRLLVNEIFEFGLKEKDCSWENLRKCPGLKGSTAEKVLNGYYKKFKNIIEIRHYNTHRGMFKDSAIDELSIHLQIYEYSRTLGMDVSDYQQHYPEIILNYHVKQLRYKRAKEINERNVDVYIYMKAFLTSLFPEFKKRCENSR